MCTYTSSVQVSYKNKDFSEKKMEKIIYIFNYNIFTVSWIYLTD